MIYLNILGAGRRLAGKRFIFYTLSITALIGHSPPDSSIK
jgi:hypothetical protein